MTYFQLLLPAGIGLILAGAILGRQKPRWARAAAIAGLLWLVLISWPPLAYVWVQPLESRYQPSNPDFRGAKAGAIVVLAAGVHPPTPARPWPMADHQTYARCTYAAWVERQLPDIPVLACGGVAARQTVPGARTMAELLESQGVRRDRIWTEERSRSTYESAVYAAGILKEKGITRIVLVTEGYHMLRSEKCFRRQGLDVVPAPSGFNGWELSVEDLVPAWKPILDNEHTLHEAVGLLWYRFRGWID